MTTLHIANPQEDISELLFTSRVANHNHSKNRVSFGCTNTTTDTSNGGNRGAPPDYYVGPIVVTSNKTPNSSGGSGNIVKHGLGMSASRDIQQGECLFVTKAAISVDVDEVYKEWKQQQSKVGKSNGNSECLNGLTAGTTTTLLEQISEQVLIKMMRQKMESNDPKDRSIVRSFLLQLSTTTTTTTTTASASAGSDNDNANDDDDDGQRMSDIPENPKDLLAALVGSDTPSAVDQSSVVDDPKLLGIIRRNAFGPDFVNYEKIEKKWKENSDVEGNQTPGRLLPSRLLGLYPLAAMINHSCVPNAVRVFAHGDYMVVHASTNIPKDHEIVWSYLPPIQPYPIRTKQLQDHHGFTCHCIRCSQEQQVLLESSSNNIYEVPESLLLLQNNNRNETNNGQQFTASLATWEQQTFATLREIPNNNNNNSLFSNEAKRYWKMGNANLYIHNLNVQLMDLSSKSLEQQNKIRNMVLLQAMELHFCFVSCHYACTEHLSIMHLCYEIVAVLHSHANNANDKSKTLPKVKFWTEQLKRAHLVRYGSLGNDINSVRGIMKHSQMVLRNRNGLDMVPYEFI